MTGNELTKPFTEQEAHEILANWARTNGYVLGAVEEMTGWSYPREFFYSARARMMKKNFSGGNYRFHIHRDGTIVKFPIEEEESED